MTCYGCPRGCSRCNGEGRGHGYDLPQARMDAKLTKDGRVKPKKAKRRSTPSGGGNSPEHQAGETLKSLLDYLTWATATGPEFMAPQLLTHAKAVSAAMASCEGPVVQVVSGRVRNVAAEEREACAQVADAFCHGHGGHCDCDTHQIARTIRLRGRA